MIVGCLEGIITVVDLPTRYCPMQAAAGLPIVTQAGMCWVACIVVVDFGLVGKDLCLLPGSPEAYFACLHTAKEVASGGLSLIDVAGKVVDEETVECVVKPENYAVHILKTAVEPVDSDLVATSRSVVRTHNDCRFGSGFRDLMIEQEIFPFGILEGVSLVIVLSSFVDVELECMSAVN